MAARRTSRSRVTGRRQRFHPRAWPVSRIAREIAEPPRPVTSRLRRGRTRSSQPDHVCSGRGRELGTQQLIDQLLVDAQGALDRRLAPVRTQQTEGEERSGLVQHPGAGSSASMSTSRRRCTKAGVR